ncbi:MAG: alanine/glycine:cation symporter family protein [Halieaceae bacterium]|jgi:AGCS family alanine or glycine:cation symporter|nr:alanine/glycine:cation symporter family protein [Halieaceae bacterium]
MIGTLTDLLWSYVLIVLLVGLGLWFTFASRFVQFRFFGAMFASLRRGLHEKEGHLSSFQALVVSVAGRVGGGNIAGVAVAITLGGPGAVFWMWLIGLMGMATSFFECSLAQLYKRAEPDGTYRGGPAYYMKYGLKKPWMAVLYSVLLLITFGFGFNAVQSFIVATSMKASFGLPVWVTGVALTVMVGVTIFGGIKRIAHVAEFVVPIMALSYVLVAFYVLATNITEVPEAIGHIVKSAFGFEQLVGGGFAAVVLQGVKRGLFSNEAGLGSAPNVAAVAYVPHPAHQGMVQSLSVFIDTLILCSATAVIILLSDAYQPGEAGVNGVALTQAALGGHVGSWGEGFVSVALLLFAFSSIMYNYYLGENSLNYFSEENQKLFTVFRILVLVLVMWGSLQDLGTVFGFIDLTMGLLGVVNLAAVALLVPIAFRLLKDFDTQRTQVEVPQLDPAQWADLDIDPRAWRD